METRTWKKDGNIEEDIPFLAMLQDVSGFFLFQYLYYF